MQYIQGWKGMLNELHDIGIKIHIRTLKEWHYTRVPIPFIKTSPVHSGGVLIDKNKFHSWLAQITNTPQDTN